MSMSFVYTFPPYLHTYVSIYKFFLYIYAYIYVYTYTHIYVCIYVFGYRCMEQIWVNNKYYSLSIAQNESPIISVINLIMHFLFLSPCECPCTISCVYLYIKKNLLIAVCIYACLQLNWIDLRVKRTGTTHGP